MDLHFPISEHKATVISMIQGLTIHTESQMKRDKETRVLSDRRAHGSLRDRWYCEGLGKEAALSRWC